LASQEIPVSHATWRYTTVDHTSTLQVPLLSQLNPSHALTPNLVILPSTTLSSTWSLSYRFHFSATLDIGVSFGLATNKLTAAIASKLNKPRGFTLVPPGGEAAFLAPLSLGKLPGIGPKTEEALKARGLKIVSDIPALTDDEGRAIFGNGWPDMLAAARGEDDSPVVTEFEDAKSYSQQETFAKDIHDFAEIERVAKGMIDALMREIRRDGKRVRTLTVKVRYPNFEQTSAARSLPPDEATNLEQPFYPWVAPLLRQAWTKRKTPLRLVSVRFSSVDDGPCQLDMFTAPANEKRQRLASVVDALNATTSTHRHGTTQIMHGGQLRK